MWLIQRVFLGSEYRKRLDSRYSDRWWKVNGYEQSVALNLTGTDAEKVAILQTLTVSNIAVDSVRVWLRENLLWFRTSPTTMGGAIQQVIESPATPDETKQQLGIFWSAVFGDGAQNLLTTVPTWAKLVWQIIQGLTQAAPDAAALVDSFYALDGGRPYKDMTVEQFAAQKAASESIAGKVIALELVTNAAAEAAREEYRKDDSTPESIIAAAAAVLEGA